MSIRSQRRRKSQNTALIRNEAVREALAESVLASEYINATQDPYLLKPDVGLRNIIDVAKNSVIRREADIAFGEVAPYYTKAAEVLFLKSDVDAESFELPPGMPSGILANIDAPIFDDNNECEYT
jgi:hypothetical protein